MGRMIAQRDENTRARSHPDRRRGRDDAPVV